MINRVYIIICFLILTYSCDLFRPESPVVDAFYVKMFGGPGIQEGVASEILGDTTFIFGNTDAFSDMPDLHKLYLIKLDKAGNQVWAKPYNGTSPNLSNQAVQMLLTDDKQHLLLLSNESANNETNVRIVKVDLNGNVVWDETITTVDGNSYEAVNMSTISGKTNFLIVGTATVGITNQIFASELDNEGRVRWLKRYTFTDRQGEYGVAIKDFNDNMIILGRSVDMNNDERPVIIEGDRMSLGEELQSKILFKNQLLETSLIKSKDLLQLNSNDFLVLCDINQQTHIVSTTINSEQSIIVPTTDNPASIETALVPENFNETIEGDLLITGTNLTNQQIGLIKYNMTNGAVWPIRNFGLDLENVTQGVNRTSTGHQVKELSDGSIIIVGTVVFFPNNMIGLIKTNSDGELK